MLSSEPGQDAGRQIKSPSLQKAVTIESSEERFVYCIPIQRLAAFCCFSSLSIRNGLYIISAIEFSVALFAVVSLMLGYDSQNLFSVMLRSVQAQGFFMGTLLCIASAKFNVGAAQVVYNWKIWEPLILDVLQIAVAVCTISDASIHMSLELFFLGTMGTSLLCLARVLYGLFSAYVIYSFVHLVNKGCHKLIQYGPEALLMMEQVRSQASVMDVCPEMIELNEVSGSSSRLG